MLNSIVTLQKGEPWAVQDLSDDFSGTGEVNNPNAWGEAWDFFGKPKDFTSIPGQWESPSFPVRATHSV